MSGPETAPSDGAVASEVDEMDRIIAESFGPDAFEDTTDNSSPPLVRHSACPERRSRRESVDATPPGDLRAAGGAPHLPVFYRRNAGSRDISSASTAVFGDTLVYSGEVGTGTIDKKTCAHDDGAMSSELGAETESAGTSGDGDAAPQDPKAVHQPTATRGQPSAVAVTCDIAAVAASHEANHREKAAKPTLTPFGSLRSTDGGSSHSAREQTRNSSVGPSSTSIQRAGSIVVSSERLSPHHSFPRLKSSPHEHTAAEKVDVITMTPTGSPIPQALDPLPVHQDHLLYHPSPADSGYPSALAPIPTPAAFQHYFQRGRLITPKWTYLCLASKDCETVEAAGMYHRNGYSTVFVGGAPSLIVRAQEAASTVIGSPLRPGQL